MVLTFEKNKRAYVSDLNNLAYQHRNAVRSGCAVIERSPAIMGVRVESGVIFFGITNIGIVQQDIAITAADLNYDRIDLIVVNNAGTASVITGTPEIEPHTPAYNPETYVVLARILVQDLATTIVTADISDLRVLNEFGYGAGGVATYLHNQTGASASWSVNHGLNDANPLVWVFDSSGDPIEPESITVVDNDNLTLVFGSAITGQAKVFGGQAGVRVQGMGYIHHQSSPSTSWIVPHILGEKYVNVQVYDSLDDQIIPNTIHLDDANQLTITFASPLAGKAVIQGGLISVTRYVHNEAAPSATWNVNHAIGEKYVTVMVFDASDNWIMWNNINLIDINNLTITFVSPVAGNAIIIG